MSVYSELLTAILPGVWPFRLCVCWLLLSALPFPHLRGLLWRLVHFV